MRGSLCCILMAMLLILDSYMICLFSSRLISELISWGMTMLDMAPLLAGQAKPIPMQI